jgi:hypothetical protein
VINKLTGPDDAKRMLKTRVILAKFLWLDENSPSTGFLRSLAGCQQELNKAFNEACQNVKDKKEPDVHKMVLKIPDAKKTRAYLFYGVLSQEKAHRACPFCPGEVALKR